MNFKKREKILRIINIIFYILLLGAFSNMIIWASICAYSNPSEEVFKREVIIVIITFEISTICAICLAVVGLKKKKDIDKFNVYLVNKEYTKIVEQFKKEREKTLSLSLFQNCTYSLGYSYMFLGDVEQAYRELHYFLEKKRISDYLMHILALYYLYVICIIKGANDDIEKIKALYTKLISKSIGKRDTNYIVVKLKKYFNYLMNDEIRLGLDPLVKAECPLIIDYLSSSASKQGLEN